MRIRHGALISIGSLALSAAAIAACGGLSHPVSDDGNDITNPKAVNPGSGTLSLSAARTDLGVGDYQAITASYNGAAVVSGQPFTATVSDPTVISGGALGARALSVGGSTITATYQGSTASITFTVHSQYGLAAIINAVQSDPNTGTTVWFPDSIHVLAGSTVEFHLQTGAIGHNVVFDSVPGAPANLDEGATGAAGLDRTLPVAGVFRFRCTLHGETGVINVLSP